MKNTLKLAICLILLCTLPFTCVYASEAPYTFVEEKSEKAIRKASGILEGDVMPADMASITELDLWCDGLTSLNDLAMLTGLQSLTLHSVKDGTDMSALAELPNLTALKFDGCQPTDLSVLTGCESLQALSFERIAATDLSCLAALPQLQKISFVSNDAADMSYLSQFPALTSLHLDFCEVSDISFLSGMTGLTELSVVDCYNVSDLSVIWTLTGLKSLALGGENYFDTQLLEPLTSLESLELSGYMFSVYPLSVLPNLHTLSVIEAVVEGYYNDFVSLPTLRTLKLDRLPILNDQLADIAAMPGLEDLTLNFCEYITNIDALNSCANLRSLTLYGCNDLTYISSLAGLTSLEKLDVSCFDLYDLSFLSEVPNLKELTVTTTDLTSIAALSQMANVKTLNLSIYNITDLSPLKDMASLETLTLNTGNMVKDFSFLSEVPTLRTVYLTDRSVDLASLANLSQLEYLNVDGAALIR